MGTGYYLASADGIETPATGAMAGASQVTGYLPLAVIGAAAFTLERTTTGTFGGQEAISLEIPLLHAVVLAGIVLPVGCGVIGGVLATRANA